MKSCPVCHAVYDDSMNYCLDHGATLVNAALDDVRELTNRDTAQYSSPDVKAYSGVTASIPAVNLTSTAKKGNGFTILLILFAGGMLLAVAGIIGGGYYLIKNAGERSADRERNIGGEHSTPTPIKSPSDVEGVKLRVDFTEETSKSNYTGTFRKAFVTNESKQAALRPTVSFGFFKGDVKVDSSVGRLGLEVLGPGEMMPVWVRVDTVKPFDRIEAVQGLGTSADKKSLAERYIDLPVTEAKMTVKTGTSLVNFKPIREPYYDVSGVVENTNATAANIIIYAIFYDKEKNVVGFASDSPDEMKPGQKVSFDITTSRNQIYGDAAEYRLVMITE